MVAIRGITVSVGSWYAETLRVCLPRNMRHLVEALIVTAPGDPSIEVACSVPGVRVLETDAFTRHGAAFNKSLAIEEGFSELGREGWIWILDADVLLCDSIPFDQLQPDCLHGMPRRILADPAAWTAGLDWATCPPHNDGRAPIGYAQLFHADAPALEGQSYWYDVSFAHAGGGDARFLSLFPRDKWVMLQAEALHLGPPDRHWFGVDQRGKDLMAKYVTENGWRRAMRGLDPEAAARAGELPGRVQVPGYPPSDFALPFEKRAAAERERRGQ